jgi:hypothetical protein
LERLWSKNIADEEEQTGKLLRGKTAGNFCHIRNRVAVRILYSLGAVGGSISIVAWGAFNTYSFVILGNFRKKHPHCHSIEAGSDSTPVAKRTFTKMIHALNQPTPRKLTPSSVISIVAWGAFNTYSFVILGNFRKKHPHCHSIADMAATILIEPPTAPREYSEAGSDSTPVAKRTFTKMIHALRDSRQLSQEASSLPLYCGYGRSCRRFFREGAYRRKNRRQLLPYPQ